MLPELVAVFFMECYDVPARSCLKARRVIGAIKYQEFPYENRCFLVRYFYGSSVKIILDLISTILRRRHESNNNFVRLYRTRPLCFGLPEYLIFPHKTYTIPKVYEATVRLYFDTEKLEDWAEYPGEFIPEFVWVDKGATITWVNVDVQQKVHTIVSDDGLFNDTIQPGGNFSFTFNSSGNFSYHCGLYKYCSPWDMFGVIYVE